MALTLLSFAFLRFLLIGVPVALSPSGCPPSPPSWYEDLPLAVAFQQMTSGMNTFSFLAIPFFIFAGELMLYGGIARPHRATSHISCVARPTCAAAWACPTWWPARCSAGCRRLAGGRRVCDGVCDDPDDEARGLSTPTTRVNVTTHAALVGALMPTTPSLIISHAGRAAAEVVHRRALIAGWPGAGPDPDGVQPGGCLCSWRASAATRPGTFPAGRIVFRCA